MAARPPSRWSNNLVRLRHPRIVLDRLRSSGAVRSSLSRCDWRGWVALAWVIFWGTLYLWTAVAPRVAKVFTTSISSTL